MFLLERRKKRIVYFLNGKAFDFFIAHAVIHIMDYILSQFYKEVQLLCDLTEREESKPCAPFHLKQERGGVSVQSQK